MTELRADTLTLADLRAASAAELEAIYAHDRAFAVPTGCYRGIHLRRLDHPAARALPARLIGLGFEYPPFGVDFDRSCWFFFHRRLGVGGFTPSIAASRWRSTQVVALDYGRSRLPAPVRGRLYDEVKPLGDGLALGLGGIDAGRERGDLFFFALERVG
jgi:hypothetical protein